MNAILQEIRFRLGNNRRHYLPLGDLPDWRGDIEAPQLEAVAHEPVSEILTVLIFDVIAFSRLIERNVFDTMEGLALLRQEIVGPVARRFNARITQIGYGDSMLLAFGSTVAALRAAATIFVEVQASQELKPRNRRIRLRLGMSRGPTIADGAGLYGCCVNIAARLQAVAEASGICMCEQARDHLPNPSALKLRPMGRMKLHNIRRRVEAYSLGPDEIAACARPLDGAS